MSDNNSKIYVCEWDKQPEQKDVYAETLINNGVPEQLAIKASEVLASDDSTKSDLGRTEADQQTINQTMDYLNKRWLKILPQ